MNMETNSHTTSPYIQLIEQIEVLQQEAKRLREQEIQSVIESIQKQITYYNITLQELGYTNVMMALLAGTHRKEFIIAMKKGRPGRELADSHAGLKKHC